MSELNNMQNSEEKPELMNVESVAKKTAWDKYMLPVSILVAGLLVAGTSLYNTRVMLQTSGSGGGKVAGITQPAPTLGGQVAPTQAPQDDGKPIQVAERSDQPVIGKKDAKVTVVEFSDFQCPFCERFFTETYGQIKTKYVDTGKVKIVFRHFPLSFHQNAQKAAEAAECASRQGKFTQYHDLLLKNSKSDGTGLNVADLKKYADQLGLNKGTLGFGSNKFNQCLDNGETTQVVNKDLSDGTAAGVTGTPSFVINGKKVVGAQPFSVFEAAIEEALK